MSAVRGKGANGQTGKEHEEEACARFVPVFCRCGGLLFEVWSGKLDLFERHVCRQCRRRVTVMGDGQRVEVTLVDTPRKRVRQSE